MLDRYLAIAGVVLGILSFIAPYRWHDMPPWLTSGGLYLAVLLMGSAIGMFINEKWGRAKPQPHVPNANLRLHTYGDDRTPTRIAGEGVWRWYTLRMISTEINRETGSQRKIGEVVTLFLTFHPPVYVGTLEISSPDFVLPQHEVKDFNDRSAVIAFSAALPAGTLEITVHP